MFNFIFESKLGDILAPVVPANKLYLAIQHHKNLEVQPIWDSTVSDPNALCDGNVAAIHVACRYNNRYAVDFALAKGTNIMVVDKEGNTPLHFAAKYGHLDLCKYLIEKGARSHLKNKQGQTTYDIAESHTVRQYLLPIVLTSEKEAAEAMGVPPPGYSDYGNGAGYPGMGGMPPGASGYAAYTPQPPPPPMGYPQHTNYAVPPPPSGSVLPPQFPPGSAADGTSLHSVPLAVGGAGQSAVLPPAASSSSSAVGRSGENRFIPSDGFHSSASDPVLQAKYGHVIEVKNIAPPPTGPLSAPGFAATNSTPSYYAAPPAQGGGLPGAGGNVYSRYVAYDATTNSAIPNQYNTPVGAPAYGGVPVPAPGYPPNQVPQQSHNPYAHTVAPVQQYPSYSPVAPYPPAAVPSHHFSAPPAIAPMVAPVPATPLAPPAPSGAQRLLGGLGDIVQLQAQQLLQPAGVTSFVAPHTPKQSSHDTMYNIDLASPSGGEGEIVNANASSSSVM